MKPDKAEQGPKIVKYEKRKEQNAKPQSHEEPQFRRSWSI
jgi:hypothetical protein